MYRDFVYMDSDRIQSIIAQLNEGVLTQIMTGKAKELTGKLGIAASVLSHLLPLNFEGSAAYTSNTQSSKVLHDYAFNIALESLEERDLMVTDEHLNPSGVFISDVAFILVHGDASIIDYTIARDLMDNKALLEMFGVNTGTQQNLNRQQRRAGAVVPQDPTAVIFEQIKQIIDAFMKDSLHVRIKLLNGTTFVGPMSRQFLREETHSFIFKYGREAQEGWTMLAQISSAPASDNKLKKLQDFVDTLTSVQSNASTVVDAFNPVVEFVYGLQEAMASVSYPSIAVTPIAIYRELNSLR
jgi:hypothetical protein